MPVRRMSKLQIQNKTTDHSKYKTHAYTAAVQELKTHF